MKKVVISGDVKQNFIARTHNKNIVVNRKIYAIVILLTLVNKGCFVGNSSFHEQSGQEFAGIFKMIRQFHKEIL